MVETLTATGKLRHVLLILSVATVGVGKKNANRTINFLMENTCKNDDIALHSSPHFPHSSHSGRRDAKRR
jgi:hypothetical protein